VVLNSGDEVTQEMLPPPLDKIRSPACEEFVATETEREPAWAMMNDAPADDSEIELLSTTERRAIEGAINRCGGNIPVAAAFLGVSASTIYRKKQLWARDAQAA
ncbi:MAG: helix-turn-helix domain-containing protein, partial [Pseudomonadota bacterium]|nr:helix-turn-helix domain-containing protein [Pseudomonadota bacterium]